MKSKVSPLALGGALAACAALLVFFGWWVAQPSETRGDLDATSASAAGDSGPGGRVDPAHPAAPADSHVEGVDSARVPLADGVEQPALPQAELELRNGSDRPLAGARALVRRGEQVLALKVSDANGVARFDADDARAELIVVPKDVPAVRREITLTAGKQVIVLERGTAVAGRVRVAREGSVAGIELRLTSDRPMFDDSEWPAEARKALELEGRDKLALATRTNEQGEFEFSGLSTPWSGSLRIGETHELIAVTGGIWTEGTDSVRLDDPTEALVLDLAALDLARGHVVASAGGPGIARASVNGTLSFEPAPGDDEGASATFDGRANADGWFALPIHRRGGFDASDVAMGIPWPALRSVTLTLDGGEDVPRRRLELSGAQLPEGFDFGELVLERGATLQFVTSDAQGKPLANAIGRLDGERSEPTDENGRSSIVYAPGTGRPLGVSLDGYRDARVDVPKEPTDALSVVLERTNRLTVIVHAPDGSPAAGILVQISGQRQVMRGNRRNRAADQRTDEKGRAVFSDLTPATQLTVTARDAMGASVGERTATLAADEWSTVELTISRSLLSFSGVVRDEQGLALAEATVEFTDVQSQNRASVDTRSDPDGRFAFSGLGNSTGMLRVRKYGFAPLSIPEFQIPPPGVIADIRLERGLRLTLRIVDVHGAPVHGENLRLELAGERPFQGRRKSSNEFDFANLPRVSMVAIGSVGSREYRQELEPLNGNQDFQVPAQGGLEVTLRLDPSLLQSPLRVSLRARDDRRVQPSQSLAAETLQTKTFVPLRPGTYQLSVLQYVRDGERGGNWTTVGDVQRVTIPEGANQRIEIER